MKNGDLLKLYETLNRITSNSELRFSVKIGYLLVKNKASIREDAQLLYNERQKIMLRYGDLQENGDIIIPREKVNEATNALDELMNVDVNVNITEIDINDFHCELSAEDIEGLMPMLVEPIYTGEPILIDE